MFCAGEVRNSLELPRTLHHQDDVEIGITEDCSFVANFEGFPNFSVYLGVRCNESENPEETRLHGYVLGLMNDIPYDFYGLAIGGQTEVQGDTNASLIGIHNSVQGQANGLVFGLVNHTGGGTGVKLGVIGNISTGYYAGLDIAVIFNSAQNFDGVALAIFANQVDDEVNGLQLAFYNDGGFYSEIWQIGLINDTDGYTEGLQLGVINASSGFCVQRPWDEEASRANETMTGCNTETELCVVNDHSFNCNYDNNGRNCFPDAGSPYTSSYDFDFDGLQIGLINDNVPHFLVGTSRMISRDNQDNQQ